LPKGCTLKVAVVSREIDGKYYVGIDCQIDEVEHYLRLDTNKAIGFDYSSTHFVVDSNGNEYNMPHFYRDKLDEIKKLKKKLNNSVPESNNYYRKQKELIKLYSKITRRRKDYLNKLSSSIIKNYDYICVEDIDLNALSKRNVLKNATRDNSFGEFVKMLEYKASDNGKRLIKVDRWYPSSKTCHVCGYVYKALDIETKSWRCPECSTLHDRDINAAINIKNEGLKHVNR